MKSGVVETKDKVFIDKIHRLKWGEKTDNSFISRTCALALIFRWRKRQTFG